MTDAHAGIDDAPAGLRPRHSALGDAVADLLFRLLALIAAAMVAVTLLQVFGRYLLHYTPTWSELLASYLLVWMAFLGAAYACHAGMHLAITLLAEKLPERPALLLGLAAHLATLGFAVCLLVAGWQQVELTWPVIDYGFGVSMGWVYMAAPVSAALMILFLGEQLIGLLRALRGALPA